MRATMNKHERMVGAALALLAGGLIVAGAQTRWWWTGGNSEIDAAIGLGSAEYCRTATRDCFVVSLADGFRGAGNFYRAALSASVASLIVVVAAVVVLLVLAANLRGRLAGRLLVVSSVTAAVMGGVFISLFPGYSGVTLGPSVIAYFAGAGLGVFAGWWTSRWGARAAQS